MPKVAHARVHHGHPRGIGHGQRFFIAHGSARMHAAVEAGHDWLLHNAGVDAETIPELEFGQTANLRAEAGHDRLVHIAGVDAELILELEFDQTLGW